MTDAWQTYAAVAIVLGTLLAFLIRAVRGKKKSGSCGNCDCGKK